MMKNNYSCKITVVHHHDGLTKRSVKVYAKTFEGFQNFDETIMIMDWNMWHDGRKDISIYYEYKIKAN